MKEAVSHFPRIILKGVIIEAAKNLYACKYITTKHGNIPQSLSINPTLSCTNRQVTIYESSEALPVSKDFMMFKLIAGSKIQSDKQLLPVGGASTS